MACLLIVDALQATNLATTPIINVFPQLLSATFNLIGGASMCFRISWRLTVIGLTSIGPLSLIMKIYLEVVTRLQDSRWVRALSLV
jgi:ABC-type multidrug transport system fused ATPase/permease subunit